MVTTTTLRTGTWTVNAAQARFTAHGLFGRTVSGTIDVISGTIEIDTDQNPRHLHVIMDPASINTGNRRRDKDLRGKRFLNVNTDPTMTVDADLIRPTPQGWHCPATLHVAGGNAPLLIAAEIDGTPSDSNVRVRGTSRLDLHEAGIQVPNLLVRRFVDVAVSGELIHTV